MAKSRVRESHFEIAWEIQEAIVEHRAVALKMEHFADRVVEKAKEFAPQPGGGHPYATGEFVDSIYADVLQRRVKGRYAPGWTWRVGSNDPKANLLEFGTGIDKPGTHAVWQDLDGKWHKSRFTPTPEFATFAKTAMFFHTHGGVL